MSDVIVRVYKLGDTFTSKASVWSMPLKQTLHINEKVLFYWLKTKEEGLLQMKSVFQGCLNPCFGLNLQPAFSAKLFWWFESEISVV